MQGWPTTTEPPGRGRGLLDEPDAVDFELEGLGLFVADEDLETGEGLAGEIGQVEAVAVADGG